MDSELSGKGMHQHVYICTFSRFECTLNRPTYQLSHLAICASYRTKQRPAEGNEQNEDDSDDEPSHDFEAEAEMRRQQKKRDKKEVHEFTLPTVISRVGLTNDGLVLLDLVCGGNRHEESTKI